MNIKKIILEPCSGSGIWNCMREAISECIKYKCEIEFTFNDRVYTVAESDLFEIFKQQHPDFFEVNR